MLAFPLWQYGGTKVPGTCLRFGSDVPSDVSVVGGDGIASFPINRELSSSQKLLWYEKKIKKSSYLNVRAKYVGTNYTRSCPLQQNKSWRSAES